MPISIPARKRTQIASRLLSWYHKSKRDLPWRKTSDPYHILLSEFMLQQTKVDTVIPYYHRFLKKFPTPIDLTRASQLDVLKAWEGLGYYARARNLHRAMQEIFDKFDGKIPDTYDTLATLPGFGPYTTAAVLSIAFNQNYAVLDGNVIRVLCRLFGIREDITQTQVEKDLWQLAEALLAKGKAAQYNQAVMELGATVCHPRSPECTACPLATLCVARKSRIQEALPVKAPKKTSPHHTMGVTIVWRKSTLLIARRPEKGLLGGLWEFPGERQEPNETLRDCCLRGLLEKTGVKAQIQNRFRTVKHVFTHFSVTMHAFQCTYQSGRTRPIAYSEVSWVTPETLSNYPFSRANRKLIESLLAQQPELF